MMSLKPTPIWDDPGRGRGWAHNARLLIIAYIAGIADIARDRKSKPYR